MFSNYGQLAEELKLGLGAIDLSRDQPRTRTSTKLLKSSTFDFFRPNSPPTMNTDVTYKVKMSILVEPNEKSRKIPWAAVELILCECTCKACRSRKCPRALLLYLIDNYTNFLSLVPAYPKIKLGGNRHYATRST